VRQLTAEFIGTMLLVLLTDGTAATARLARSHGVGGNWLTIAVGSAIAVSIAVGLAGPISGGHVNPAVTFALAAWGLFPAERVAAYVGHNWQVGSVARSWSGSCFGDIGKRPVIQP
jgi:glycerol uptake facilitator-like aquaporin